MSKKQKRRNPKATTKKPKTKNVVGPVKKAKNKSKIGKQQEYEQSTEFKAMIAKVREDVIEKTKEIPHKFVDASFSAIEGILNIGKCEIIIPSVRKEGFPAVLYKDAVKGYKVAFEALSHLGKFISGNWISNDLELKTIGLTVKLIGVQMTGTSNRLRLERGTGEFFEAEYSINLHVTDFHMKSPEVSYFRCLIEAEKMDLYGFFNVENFIVPNERMGLGLFQFELNKRSYSIFTTTRGDKNYLAIDCGNAVALEEFKFESYSILLALGFITGKFLQNEWWLIEASDSDYRNVKNLTFETLRDTLICSYQPFFNNPNSFLRGRPRPADIPVNLERVNGNIFSTFCTEILITPKLMGALLVLMESHGKSIYSRGAGYSVTLEILTQIVSEKNDGFKPIISKPLAKRLIKDLQDVLERYEKEISDKETNPSVVESMRILRNKLLGLNAPTNADKLSLPFKLYGVILTDDELAAITHRNSFLHGYELRKAKDIYMDDRETFGVVLNLLTMLHKLLLKSVGFSGHIINYHEFYYNADTLNPDRVFFKL